METIDASTQGDDMSSRTRIPKADLDGIPGATMTWISKKRLGEVPSPLGVIGTTAPSSKATSL
jgi:hypothetical protein